MWAVLIRSVFPSSLRNPSGGSSVETVLCKGYIGIHRGLGHVLSHTGMETNPPTSLWKDSLGFRVVRLMLCLHVR